MDMPFAFDYPADYFDVCDTLECGQVFRYKRLPDGTYEVFSRDKAAQLRQEKGTVSVYTDDAEYFRRYFDLDEDYAAKVTRISAISPLMRQAADFGKGIRILNQDLTEMIFSFIISANNNIKRIQLIIDRLCNALGNDAPYGKAFPTVEAMAAQPISFYTFIGAGYRDKYLQQTAQMLLDYDLSGLCALNTAEARKRLLKFQGVGPKVADCILLFGLRRQDVFPVDTWLKKVYHAYFEQGHKDADISAFFCDLFGDDAGLCQQYLFYFQRKYGQNGGNTVQ